MRAVVQLVSKAQVRVDDTITGAIDHGLVVLLGVHRDDTEKDATFLAEKTVNLRIFQDQEGKMNRSLLDEQGSMLVVSQFTLFGDCRKGRRPSYSSAAPPKAANRLYEYFVKEVEKFGVPVETGQFQAMMEVALTNNGPVTLLLDSTRLF